ncbi:glutathione S-transferase family protein [Candidatus Uhrbacteria bacterium]|nr:glutathione S-transferase family protein [Candidatus Uhrbacteria bacterium]
MTSIKLYGPSFGTGFRCYWTLHELELPFESMPIDFAAGQLRSEEFLKLNPMGQVPVIDVDGFVLAESIAINHYLVAKFKPEFSGKTLEEQAVGLKWSIWAMLNINGSFGTLASPSYTHKALEPTKEQEVKENLAKRLPIFEACLNERAYVLSTGFSLADVNICSVFAYADLAQFDLSAYPNIVSWVKRCHDRPSFLKATTKA